MALYKNKLFYDSGGTTLSYCLKGKRNCSYKMYILNYAKKYDYLFEMAMIDKMIKWHDFTNERVSPLY